MKNENNQNFSHGDGYVALATTIITLIISVSVISGFTFFALGEVHSNRAYSRGIEARAVAEGGIEDAVYRLVSGKQVGAQEEFAVGKGTTTIIFTSAGNQRLLRSEGARQNSRHHIETRIDIATTPANFYYGAQVGAGGLSMKNNARVDGSVYSNGVIDGANGAAITGDAIAVGKIEDMIVGNSTAGTARAPQFEDTTVHGSPCPNQYCIIDNPAPQNLPIATATIQQWKNDAAAGGLCVQPECNSSGDFEVSNGQTKNIGPKKITGKLKVDNGATLIIEGTLWVQDDITISNNCAVRLNTKYGVLSGVVITDAKATVSNNCSFQGSGDPGSFIMLLSDKNSPAEEILTIDNNSLGVIYYAGQGRIKFSNNAVAKEATAYGVTLDNGATITYESGLQNINFSSGPAGGYDMKYWKEVE